MERYYHPEQLGKFGSIAEGSPEEVAQVGESYTGKFLREIVG